MVDNKPTWELHLSDCLEGLRKLPDNSIDSVVTDPPAGISFLGESWDSDKGGRHQWVAWMESIAVECLRVLKPGGHALVWSLPRTSHWTGWAWENAGWECRDSITHVNSMGFPKSQNIAKSIDKTRHTSEDKVKVADWLQPLIKKVGLKKVASDLGVSTTMVSQHWCSHSQTEIPTLDHMPKLLESLGITIADIPEDIHSLLWTLNGYKHEPGANWEKREIIGEQTVPDGHAFASETYGRSSKTKTISITSSHTDLAKKWEGWGTGLKPAAEIWILFRKPLSEPTVVANVLKHGTGAINIDGCRVATVSAKEPDSGAMYYKNRGLKMPANKQTYFGAGDEDRTVDCEPMSGGRWPANFILSHLDSCRKIGTRVVKTGIAYEPSGGGKLWSHYEDPENPKHKIFGGLVKSLGRECTFGDSKGNETVDAWECQPECPVKSLDDQTGILSTTWERSEKSKNSNVKGTEWGMENHQSKEYPGEVGGASRFYKQIQPTVAEQSVGIEYECAPNCPVAEINEQSGITESNDNIRHNGKSGGYNGVGNHCESSGFSDSGGASRFFQTLQPSKDEAVEYECDPNCPVAEINEQSGEQHSSYKDPEDAAACVAKQKRVKGSRDDSGSTSMDNGKPVSVLYTDSGGAGRFFYTAKPSKAERNAGGKIKNNHPTPKSLKLMRYLCRLICPPGGTVLDPFTGSGSTGVAALQEGFNFVGFELESEYHAIATRRLQLALNLGIWEDPVEEPKLEPKNEEPVSMESILGFDD